MSMFINRTEELKTLRKIFSSKKAELVLVYGRRRIGKSTLLLEAIKGKDAVYFLADMSKNILEVLAKQTTEQFTAFSNWDDFFEFIYKSRHKIFVIDEFQYLYDIDKAWPTILQRWWEKLRKTDKKIVLCGPIISTIYRIARGYGSALYGRKTYEFEVKQLGFEHISGFFSYPIHDLIVVYSVLGGIPRYLEEFDKSKSVRENIRHKLLEKISFLYNEPVNLLYEEFRDAAPYISILLAIAQGYVRFHDISVISRIESNKLPKYISTLERVGIVEKDIPVTEKKLKGKITRYRIKDNFYRFWFRFIFGSKSRIEQGQNDYVLEDTYKNLQSYVGYAFEDICISFVTKSAVFNFTKVGRWWHKDSEIDICALNENTGEILFGECKWQDNVDAENVMQQLKEKSRQVKWNDGSRKERFVVFARSYAKKIKGAYDLKDIDRHFRHMR